MECQGRVSEPGVWEQSSHMPVCAGEEGFVSNAASETDLRNVFLLLMDATLWLIQSKETPALFKSNIYLAQEEK